MRKVITMTKKTQPRKQDLWLTNEDGSVMVLALALLMLLTLIGISATTTSTIDIQIAGAKKTHTEYLYLAEAAAMECVQDMEDKTDLPTQINTTYLNAEGSVSQGDIQNLTITRSDLSSIPVSSGTTGYAAVSQGVVGSLKMGQASLHSYVVYGWHNSPQGRVILELGYRKAS